MTRHASVATPGLRGEWRIVRLVARLTLAACCWPGLAAAGDALPSIIDKLAQTGELFCRPSLPFFCGNMHVSCAFQTSIEAFAFKLTAKLAQGTIEAAAENDELRKQYVDGRIEWDKEGAYVILFPRQASGYIKLLSDGRYSFRHYSNHGAVMSIGRCM